jgi:glutamate-1-semialdehyde aminotransferase
MVAYCGGGGVWHDWFITATSRNLGVPKFNSDLIRVFNYNDIKGLAEIFDQNKGKIACVCIEPVVIDEPKKGFLEEVKKLAHENGALLIFDEVVTGFRMALGGAQEYFGIRPDISCFGKAMANGMPLGAVAGKKEYMEIFHEIFYSTTYAGEITSLAAGRATITALKETGALRHVRQTGVELKAALTRVIDKQNLPIEIQGMPHRLKISVKDGSGKESLLLKSILYQECVERGVIFGPGAVLHTYSHSAEDTKKTAEVFAEAGEVLAKAAGHPDPSEFLRGEVMKPVLRFPV